MYRPYDTETALPVVEHAEAPAAGTVEQAKTAPRATTDFIAKLQSSIDAVAKARQHHALERLRLAAHGSGFKEIGEAEGTMYREAEAFAATADDESVFAIAREIQARYDDFARDGENLDDRFLDSQMESALLAASKRLVSSTRERRAKKA